MPRPRSTTRKPPASRRRQPAAPTGPTAENPGTCKACGKRPRTHLGADFCETCSTPIARLTIPQASPITLAPPVDDQPPAERPAPTAGDVVLFRISMEEESLRPAIVVRVTDSGCDLKVHLVPGEPTAAAASVDRLSGFVHSALAGSGVGEWRAR